MALPLPPQTRRSMVFAKHLRAVGDEFRSKYLNSTDEADRIPFQEDWTKMKVAPPTLSHSGTCVGRVPSPQPRARLRFRRGRLRVRAAPGAKAGGRHGSGRGNSGAGRGGVFLRAARPGDLEGSPLFLKPFPEGLVFTELLSSKGRTTVQAGVVSERFPGIALQGC